MTPTSTDPRIATLFGTEASRYGEGVVHILEPQDLAGIRREPANFLGELEKEVVLAVPPLETEAAASLTVPVEQARSALADLGHPLPRTVTLRTLSSDIRELPPAQNDLADQFINKVKETLRGR